MSVAADVTRAAIDAAHRVTRPVLLDVEHVPATGPFVLVGNHQLLGMQDLPSLVRELERRRGRLVHGMADHFHFLIPGWRELLRQMGAVPGTRENCRELLAAGEPVLVLPGGAREVYKRRDQRYQLLWDGRTGFARMAIAAGCPIVPFGAVGAEDRFDVLLDVEHPLAAPVRAVTRRIGREDVGTVLVRGTVLGFLPGFGRLYFGFGEPIATTPWAGREDDRAAREELRDQVRVAVEAQIARLLALRAADPQRGIGARVVAALQRG